jgi:hypothetical protein
MALESVGLRLWRASLSSTVSPRGKTALTLCGSGWPLLQKRCLSYVAARNSGNSRVDKPLPVSPRSPRYFTLANPRSTCTSHDTVAKLRRTLSLAQHRCIWTKGLSKAPLEIEKEKGGNGDPTEQAAPRVSYFSKTTCSAQYKNNLSELHDDAFALELVSRTRPTTEKESSGDSPKINCWLDVTNPTAAEIEQLSLKLGLHPLTTEDILAQESQNKVEVHAGVSARGGGEGELIQTCLTDHNQLHSTPLSRIAHSIESHRARRISHRSTCTSSRSPLAPCRCGRIACRWSSTWKSD